MTGPEEADLPFDPDAARSGTRALPLHLRPAALLLVAGGGAIGVAVREALVLAFPADQGRPAVLGINVAGAFVLGVLLDALARRGADIGRRRAVRLLLGTGFCGGFTTYSALATATAQLLVTGAPGDAALYALGTVLAGGGATYVGLLGGALLDRGRR